MSKGRILVVEDNLDTANLLRTHFEAQEYEVLTVSRGDDVFKTCYRLDASYRMKLPDVILLDTTLPDVDGYDLCRQLRDDHHTHGVSIILLVQDKHSDKMSDVADLGADDFVTKPFDVKDIQFRVQRAMPGYYFPRGTFADAYYSKYLLAMKEPTLSDATTAEGEIYRYGRSVRSATR